MDECERLIHTKWECKHHVVLFAKCRRKALYGKLRAQLGEFFHQLAKQKESRIEEGYFAVDHVHRMIVVPPKYAVSNVIGYIKGKSAIHVARIYGERKRNFVGQHFLGSGLLRIDGRTRRGDDPSLHKEPGATGPATGTDEAAGLNGHRGWPTSTRGRVSEPA
jgi:putative transposase